ncbi:hypothetical protein Arnit_0682 [Arcobacter nitrofigilis DSM 7299]|uniref:Uncharacterized protein n=1 Tax=Arcobacter nitrofigilis (strain ATCC 33309 / DSM 7299 / CCUG 15893 / LMG 7604 / NCTC 12251 / CI) TaxID=572480 RepID=D5V2B4_ARCNC|nr:hypothetical protein [Arcobacter nitrofigilis]ADG92347.1 hypothetical protein Arnit_0682 [Arcobacter nitrofigilis DSM 7299]
MCLVISLLSFAIAYNFYDSKNLMPTIISFTIGIFFLLLMIRNIKNERSKRKN